MVRQIKWALAWVWMAMAVWGGSGAFAQVYKCGDPASPVFSDKPCSGAGAGQSPSLATKSPAQLAPQAQFDFHVSTRHYYVHGKNLAAAYVSLRSSHPGGFAGFARWIPEYRYDSKSAPSGCFISQLAVKITGEILMPQWIQESTASLNDQSQWQTMYSNLKRHEDGHIQHGREFGVLLRERLLGIGTVPCDELANRAKSEYQRLYENLKRRDEEYDRRTDHGLRQDNPR